MKEIPGSRYKLRTYLLNTPNLIHITPELLNTVVNAKIVYKDLRMGIDMKIPPSIFKRKIRTTNYDCNPS